MSRPDVLVVGGGSAGCVLAARLSEDPSRRVLLLEAGGPNAGLRGRIPAAFPRLFRTLHDWALETDPEPGLDRRAMYWPRGRLLGGSGAINAMLWVRGHQADYDGWAAAGNPGWGWDDVLPFFRRAERHAGVAGDHVGHDGPMPIGPLRQVNPLTRACLAAAEEAGIPVIPDLNVPAPEGMGLLHVTQARGERASAATAYLRPALRRPNLEVRTGAHVLRVVCAGPRAVGVEVATDGHHETLTAGEVILAAGAVHSPHLLQLSGIGEAAALEALGVPVVADLPGVGRNLQDHLAAGIGQACTRPVSLAGAESPRHLAAWLVARRGPLTSTVAEAAGFIRSGPGEERPDLELLFAPTFFLDHGFGNPPGHGFTLAVVLLRPQSRGRVSLRSADPWVAPGIEANYLAEGDDARRLLAGLDTCRRVLAGAALARWRGPERVPGETVQDAEGMAAHLRATAQTLYHPVGTCRMGTDPEAVVDPALGVHGVDGLRVVDASVMPTIVSGHTNAPTIMIAERAAALLS